MQPYQYLLFTSLSPPRAGFQQRLQLKITWEISIFPFVCTMKTTVGYVTIVSLFSVELYKRNNRGSVTGHPQGTLSELWKKSFTVICFRSRLLRSFTFMSSYIHLPTEKKVQLRSHWFQVVLQCSVCLYSSLTGF